MTGINFKWVALGLSLILPGLGQAACNRVRRGIGVFILAVVLSSVGHFGLSTPLLEVIITGAAAWDAYHVAQGDEIPIKDPFAERL